MKLPNIESQDGGSCFIHGVPRHRRKNEMYSYEDYVSMDRCATDEFLEIW